MAFESEEGLAGRSIPDVDLSILGADRQPTAIGTPSHGVGPGRLPRRGQRPKQQAAVRVE